jgi:hypothetical protein
MRGHFPALGPDTSSRNSAALGCHSPRTPRYGIIRGASLPEDAMADPGNECPSVRKLVWWCESRSTSPPRTPCRLFDVGIEIFDALFWGLG